MTQLLTDNEISTVVHDIDCGEVRPFDIEFARAIESAVLAKLREQNEPVALPFAILDEEMKDLHRFHECVTDGEGYDVPKEKMKCLAEIGLVRRVTANVYEHTTFGLSVINGDFTHPAPIPEGWQLVPIEPTTEMIIAGNDGFHSPDMRRHTVSGCYKAMLNAAKERGMISANTMVDMIKELTAERDRLRDVLWWLADSTTGSDLQKIQEALKGQP